MELTPRAKAKERTQAAIDEARRMDAGLLERAMSCPTLPMRLPPKVSVRLEAADPWPERSLEIVAPAELEGAARVEGELPPPVPDEVYDDGLPLPVPEENYDEELGQLPHTPDAPSDVVPALHDTAKTWGSRASHSISMSSLTEWAKLDID